MAGPASRPPRFRSGTPDTRSRASTTGSTASRSAGNYLTRDWEASVGYRQIGEEFNPEVGFVNRLRLPADRTPGSSTIGALPARPGSESSDPTRPGRSSGLSDGFSESYLVHIDNHFQFENGAFFQLPGINLTGEGLEQPFEIREGIVIPAGTYHNVEWQMRANTNRSAPLSASAGWTWGGFYTGSQFSPNVEVAYRFRDRFTRPCG